MATDQKQQQNQNKQKNKPWPVIMTLKSVLENSD